MELDGDNVMAFVDVGGGGADDSRAGDDGVGDGEGV